MRAAEILRSPVWDGFAGNEPVASMTVRLLRGAGGPWPHLEYCGFPAAEANAALNDATVILVRFESIDVVPHADEIEVREIKV